MKDFAHIPKPSEITPQAVYLNRRMWMQQAAILSFTAMQTQSIGAATQALGILPKLAAQSTPYGQGLTLTPYEKVTSYNNFYEFGTDKTDPKEYAHTLKTKPWLVTIAGAVQKPLQLDIDDLRKLAPMEERIYRLRCVEAWSMVVPWVGFPLKALLDKVQPTGNAKFIAFTSLADKEQMPGVRGSVLQWPYIEGLRLDEALHPLTLLTFGLYGEILPNQNGAPLRIVVPWKYGFKSAKSIVKIELLEKMPLIAWAQASPSEYGFYSNVNPNVSHPRWSQKTERFIGGNQSILSTLLQKRQETLMFNGYAEQVASLYQGMDLVKNF